MNFTSPEIHKKKDAAKPRFNPLTAGAAYVRVFISISTLRTTLIIMIKIKCDIKQQYLKRVDLHFVKSNNFHSLEVVDRVSETQLQGSENSN